jgi:flagellar hook protein FlgE
MAISGQGFFSVSETAGIGAAGTTQFNPQTFYTQAGDFQLNNSDYLVNGAGQYLQGWAVNPQTGIANQSVLAPIQITQTQFNPVPTSTIDLSANLPATPATNTPVSSQIQVYDALGNAQTLTLGWTQNSANDWTVTISSPNASTPTIATAEVQFGAASPSDSPAGTVPAGTIGSFGTLTGGVAATTYAANQPATLALTTNFGSGSQTINLTMGDFGEANGVTQFAGTTYSQGSQLQQRADRNRRTGADHHVHRA